MGRRPGTFVALLATALLTVGCGGDSQERVRLIEGTRSSPDRYGETFLAFQTPARGATVTDTSVSVRFALSNFAIGDSTPGASRRGLALSERGQHLHLVVDDEPYRAVYDVSSPTKVTGLQPGFHLLRAFPSRQWHESVKREGAYAMSWFYVPEERTPADSTDVGRAFDPETPLLTYSRPKGTYAGSDADSIMVDFYLSNVAIGPEPDDHRVRLTVDDTLSWDLTRWAPHYLLGLATGPHTVELELIAPDSTVLEGPFAPVERTIFVRRGGPDG